MISKLFRTGFVLALVAILAIALMPAARAPMVFASDKLNHILAFFVLAAGGRIAWPQLNGAVLVGLLAAYGGLIEILQWEMGYGRDADWMDFLADVIAILAGMAVGHAFLQLFQQERTPAET
ncbi:teicoplanin resistance protein VanZ [Qipengyuania spongiae]|uniref:Teicoplanin resistance protein VanZ n=1 Tax=Qipengyuania spongiae TaxID=2909673 RepID=A0ABY5SWH6_9SPHN|nr:teicoplanin resistance protein VanZ [Qipengyuania spongiae]UVI38510.1 teicoplanin resistance protein VanZ [Qipengyuania spongiae]